MKTIQFFFTLLLPLALFSQSNVKNPENSLCLNFGSGTVLSIDYERAWYTQNNTDFFIASLGIGAGVQGEIWTLYDTVEETEWYAVSPQKVTYNIGNGKNFLELGVGGILVFGNTTQPFIAYPIIGYRFIGNNNTTFKFYISWPFSGIKTDDLGFVPVGLSFGQFF